MDGRVTESEPLFPATQARKEGSGNGIPIHGNEHTCSKDQPVKCSMLL